MPVRDFSHAQEESELVYFAHARRHYVALHLLLFFLIWHWIVYEYAIIVVCIVFVYTLLKF